MAIVIDKISFENYRQYGTGYLSFTSSGGEKLSVLIAKNGTGKTTILNAITWCLYGKELHLADEKKALPVVNSDVAKKVAVGDSVPVSVTVTVLDNGDVIEFQRTIAFKIGVDSAGNNRVIAGHSALKVSSTEAGFTNTIVKEGPDADIIVKQYFDETIFKFYFFDGEKLRDFFTASQANSIQQSIFNISQVTLLENACSRLAKMHGERTKKLAKDSPDIAALNEEQEKQEKRLATAKETLSDNRQLVDDLSKERDRLDDILRGYAPVKALQKERTELEGKLKEIEAEEETHHIEKVSFIRKYTVLLTLYPRIKRTLEIISEKEANGDLPPAIDKDLIKKILTAPSGKCPVCDADIGDKAIEHMNELLALFKVSSQTSNYLKEIKGPLESYADEAVSFKTKLDAIREYEKDLASRKEAITTRLTEIGASLASFDSTGEKIDVPKTEEDRSGVIHQINIANQAIGAAKVSIQNCEERLVQIEATRAAAMKKMSEHKDIQKQVSVIEMLHTNFRHIKNTIMDEMKKEIENTTWKFFDAMIWKKNTFGSISISDSYDISVYDKNGTEMTGSLSATEQMALAYAFTLAIHKASGKNCPLVIDSPLGRVSDENRENMASALLDVSKEKQIIMLFTPDEYSESVRQIYSEAAKVRELNLSDDENYVEGIEH